MAQIPPELLDGGDDVINHLRRQLADETTRRRKAEKQVAAIPAKTRGVTVARRERDLAETSELRHAQETLDSLVNRLVDHYESYTNIQEMFHVARASTTEICDLGQMPGHDRVTHALERANAFYEQDKIRTRLRVSNPAKVN